MSPFWVIFFEVPCHHRLDELTPREIDRFKAKKRGQEHQYGKGYAPKTVNNFLSLVHRIAEKAIEYGYIEKNPVTKKAWLKPETTPEDSENWWIPDEEAIATLESWCEARPLERIVILTQLTVGLRFSEIRALEKRDLDFKVPGLWVRRSQARKQVGTPKNKRARFQVITKGARQRATGVDASHRRPAPVPREKGGPLANNSLNRAKEAGIRPISSHGAKHTSGSSYAVMGAGQRVIATLLGHADVGTTQRYQRYVDAVSATQPSVEERWRRLKNESKT